MVAGRGFRKLRRAGIKVRVGVLEDECRALIEVFRQIHHARLPFVTLKLAATLDGKIAAASGDARWISGEDSRADGASHAQRGGRGRRWHRARLRPTIRN